MSRHLSFFSFSFSCTLWSTGIVKFPILQVLFFCWLLLGQVFWPRLGDPFIIIIIIIIIIITIIIL